MKYFAYDTSAFFKRYHSEHGSSFVIEMTDQLLATMPTRIVISRIIVAEVVWVLQRTYNRNAMSKTEFEKALDALVRESHLMSTLHLDDDTVDAAHPIILRHNLNSSDAIFLDQCMQAATALRQFGNELVLVASDSRLLRAAVGEGLAVLNPETDTEAMLIS